MANISAVQTSPTGAQAQPKPTPRAARHSMPPLIRMVLVPALWAGLLFAGAGRVDWLRGWICIGLFAITAVACPAIAGHYNPSLLEARRTWFHKDAKRSDRILVMTLLPLVVALPLVAGLDAARFRWSSLSFLFVYVGIILFVLAIIVVTWTMSINPFAERAVRIQTERGHRVITSGPYHVVRHPLYTASIVMWAAVSLILGSLWALVVTGLIAVLLSVRTAMEDRMLRQELHGYEQYAMRTRYRLLPGIW